MSLSAKPPERLATPCHGGPAVDKIFTSILHILGLAEKPQHWSEANRADPDAVQAWLKSVRFAAASRLDALPARDSLRLTTRPVWLWMPLRPIHDRIQLCQDGLRRYFPSAMIQNFPDGLTNPVVLSAYQKLTDRDVPNEGIDLVDKVWRALRWIPDLEIIHWSERPHTRYFRSLAFPYWTTIYPYEYDWRPEWCSACGFPLAIGGRWRVTEKVPARADQMLCPGCTQLHGAVVFKSCLAFGRQIIPAEMDPSAWGWLPVAGPPLPHFLKQRTPVGSIRYWTDPKAPV